jgi:hypothetical protein
VLRALAMFGGDPYATSGPLLFSDPQFTATTAAFALCTALLIRVHGGLRRLGADRVAQPLLREPVLDRLDQEVVDLRVVGRGVELERLGCGGVEVPDR